MIISNWTTVIRRIKDASIILTCISITVGVIVNLATLNSSWRKDRLAGIDQAKQMFDREIGVKDQISQFLAESNDLPPPEVLLTQCKTGRGIYYANNATLKHFRDICHHYEQVGALIRNGYLDFDLYSDIVPFPDDFWDSTKALRKTIKANWNGKDAPLPDFLSNFAKLRKMYHRPQEVE